MRQFNESGLVFKFSDDWEVFKLDEETYYTEKIRKHVPETKSIDFIGYNDNKNILVLIEVKSFRGYGNRTNIERLTGKSDDLTVEVAQKIRDSIATIVGGARNSTNLSEIWKKYVNHINSNKNLKVMAWVELDTSTETALNRSKVNISTRRKVLRKRLAWLTSDVIVYNTKNYNNELEGVEISL